MSDKTLVTLTTCIAAIASIFAIGCILWTVYTAGLNAGMAVCR